MSSLGKMMGVVHREQSEIYSVYENELAAPSNKCPVKQTEVHPGKTEL